MNELLADKIIDQAIVIMNDMYVKQCEENIYDSVYCVSGNVETLK